MRLLKLLFDTPNEANVMWSFHALKGSKHEKYKFPATSDIRAYEMVRFWANSLQNLTSSFFEPIDCFNGFISS